MKNQLCRLFRSYRLSKLGTDLTFFSFETKFKSLALLGPPSFFKQLNWASLYFPSITFLLLLLLPISILAQQAGDLDRSFNYGRGPNYQFNNGYGTNGLVYTAIAQPDGKIIIGGTFTRYNGIVRNRLARLNADGGLDFSFDIGTGLREDNNSISAIAIQPDGKILIGGNFGRYNQNTRGYLVRLNPDGSLDNSFNIPSDVNRTVNSIVLQPDGKILIGGSFDNSLTGTLLKYIARLNPNGSIDQSFNPGTGPNGSVTSISLEPSGKIILSGSFTGFNGLSRNRIVRLNENGSIDNTFNIGTGANNSIITTKLQADGKIIIGGTFTTYSGVSKPRIARLNSNGTLDPDFSVQSNTDSSIRYLNVITTVLLPTGKILIGGQFSGSYESNYTKIFRLNNNGSLDTTFNTEMRLFGFGLFVNAIVESSNNNIIVCGGFNSFGNIVGLNADGQINSNFNEPVGPNYPINSVISQPDGKTIITGIFTRYNSTSLNCLARLNTDGSLDTSFNIGSGTGTLRREIYASLLQPDGKIIIGGLFTTYNGAVRNLICRINTNGSLDTTFNTTFIESGQVNALAIQPNGKIIVGGVLLGSNGELIGRIVRLNTNGSIDTTFNSGTGPNSTIYSITIQPDEKIVVGGSFTLLNGLARNNLARLNADGSLDTSFNPEMGPVPSTDLRVLVTKIQSDGKILVGGSSDVSPQITRRAIIRLNTNGSLDTTFNRGNRGPNSFVHSIIIQPDGKIIITGSFSSYNYNDLNCVARLNADGSIDTSVNYPVVPYGSVEASSLQPNGNIIIGGAFQGYDNFATPNLARIYGNTCPQFTTPTINGDSTICLGNTVRLGSSSLTGNLWSTGDTTQYINVAQPGSYSVRIIYGGCTSALSAPFRVISSGPITAAITYDTLSDRCLGERIRLSPAGNYAYYLWNTGETTRSIYTSTSGQYSVQVANSDSCFGAPSAPIFMAFDTVWCRVEIYRLGTDSITANVWADSYIWYLDGIQLLANNTLKTIPIQGNGVYTFKAVRAGRTSELSNPIVITSSKSLIETSKLEVYPNPAENRVTIKTSNAGVLQILNSVGKLVATEVAKGINEIDISKLPKGLYTVRFNGQSQKLAVR